MKTLNLLKRFSLYALLAFGIIFTGCNNDDDAPAPENPEEEITDVVLIFTNQADANDVVRATATDPDGTGVEELTVQTAPIVLRSGATYKLTYEIKNGDEDVLAEDISKELEEHQVFYAFTDGIFTSPTGDGNVGANSAADPIDYVDKDANGNNVGFETTWETGTAARGTFRAILKHQPDVKSATSTTEDGGTDFDLTFNLTVQ